MATDFVMPRAPDQQHPIYFGHQQQFQQTSPQHFHQQSAFTQAPPIPTPHQGHQKHSQISPLSTSSNGSPTSPKTLGLGRPIRPLYMPAVLRPTEFPSKAPLPRQVKPEDEDSAEEHNLRPNSSFIGGLGALGRLSRRSTGDSGKCVDDQWNLDQFPKPTGTPTRRHWKPDHESTVCDHATCKRYFSYFTRRHHCRKCGNIFCDHHSRFEVPLDQDADYNPRGYNSRACAHCYAQFKEWRSRTNSQASSLASSEGNLPDQTLFNPNLNHSPTVASPTSVIGMRLPPTQPAEHAAQSVPRDWHWSTF